MTEVAGFFDQLGAPPEGYALPGLAVVLSALALFLLVRSLRAMSIRYARLPGAEKQNHPLRIIRLLQWRAKFTPRSIEWRRPVEAMDAWADQSLVAQKNEELERWMDLCHGSEVTENKLRDMASGDYRPLLRQSEIYRRLKEESDQQLHQFWDDLCHDMECKLVGGELIARGMPAASGADEAVIRRREWRALLFDPQGARALEKNTGSQSARYEALMIGNRKQ